MKDQTDEKAKCEYYRKGEWWGEEERRTLLIYPDIETWTGFLVADTQLYKRLCPSVRPSVGPSVRPSVMVIELKTSVFDTFFVCLSVGGGLGCGWGLDAPAHPSATIL